MYIERKALPRSSLQSFQLLRWYRKLGMFYKIFNSKSPQYFFNLTPEKKRTRRLQEMLAIFLFLKSSTTFIKSLSVVGNWVKQPRSQPSQFRKFWYF